MISRVAVIGLGKLGLPMSACFAAAGLEVLGVDVNAERVRAVDRGHAPTFEPGLAELMSSAASKLSATTSIEDAVHASEATFIVVPTPSLPDGTFSLEYVLDACASVGRALRGCEWQLVVVTSTVSPGSTGGEIRERLEEASGKSASVDFGLCYSPEFIALGSVIEDFLRPDFILIGESDERSGTALGEIYERVCVNRPPVARMNAINAEIAKIALNTFVTTKIAFANMLAEVCEAVDGGDVDAVTGALGLDRRVGSHYLRGGLGYGGPCFPRDNRALANFVGSLGLLAALPKATDAANEEHAESVVRRIRSVGPAGATVGVLGLSYKPNTDVVEGSAGLEIAERLSRAGVKVIAFDPVARTPAGSALQRLEASVDDVVAAADVIVVTTPWPEIVDALPGALGRVTGARVVVDCWRAIDPARLPDNMEYVAIGVS